MVLEFFRSKYYSKLVERLHAPLCLRVLSRLFLSGTVKRMTFTDDRHSIYFPSFFPFLFSPPTELELPRESNDLQRGRRRSKGFPVGAKRNSKLWPCVERNLRLSRTHSRVRRSRRLLSRVVHVGYIYIRMRNDRRSLTSMCSSFVTFAQLER